MSKTNIFDDRGVAGKLFRATETVEWWSTHPNERSSEYPTFGTVQCGDLILCIVYKPGSYALFVSNEGTILNMPLVKTRPGFPDDKWEYVEAILLKDPTVSGTHSFRRTYTYKWFVEFLELAFPV
jgi:hypothetical protein